MSRRSPIPQQLRCTVYRRDRFRCRYCTKRVNFTTGTIDHVIPVCADGLNSEWNLVTACWPCNTAKGDKTLDHLGWLLLPAGMTLTQAEIYGLVLPKFPERYTRGRRSKKARYVNHRRTVAA